MAWGLISHPQKDDIIGNKDYSDDIMGPIGLLPNFLCTHPQSSEFLSEVWANSKGSLLQGQHPANQIQLNSSCGRAGGGFLSCDTQINLWKFAKIHQIALHFEHEGVVKTKLSKYIVKRAWKELSISF
jgi:hypothetical protein